MKRRNRKIILNDEQRSQAMAIFSHGINEANIHIRKILLTGRNLFTRCGIKVNLGMAIKRRKRCKKMFMQAYRGFIV
jgi:hypothetical protein